MKKRYCECGRELEKRCIYCSECGYYYRQISNDKKKHNYRKTEKYVQSRKRTEARPERKEYLRKYREEHREELNQKKKEEYRRRRNAENKL